MAGRLRCRLPAVRRGEGGPGGQGRRGGGAQYRGRGGLRVRIPRDRAEAAGIPGPRRPHRGQLAPPTGRGQGTGTLWPAGIRTRRGGLRPDRQRARGHRGSGLPRLLPDRAGHRAILRAERHPVPGPRVIRQLRRLRRDRDPQRGSRPAGPALRALPVGGPGRTAGHRPGHRAPAPGGGDPVRLRQVRPAERRPGRQRDLLPAADGAAGRGPGARLRARPDGRLGQAGGPAPVWPRPADPVRVFQVECRAQMATLPRLRPREFYDLVVEVALIRPGPIQGGSVHPYMRRRHGDEMADLPHESMRLALGKTLGVPLFQEQMMQLAIDCAFFTPTEADRLRHAMSSKRPPARIEQLPAPLLEGMTPNPIPADVAEDIYVKILAFSSYGFPESHAISFAYLVYASAWLKCYYPAAFTAALLRAQPMGFYSPASLISDVRRHRVEVRGVDVNVSAVLAALENPAGGGAARGAGQADPAGGKPVAGQPAIRLGLSHVRHLRADPAAAVVAGHPHRALGDFARRPPRPAPPLGPPARPRH